MLFKIQKVEAKCEVVYKDKALFVSNTGLGCHKKKRFENIKFPNHFLLRIIFRNLLKNKYLFIKKA